jgi:thiamine pyrophosphate-dependent acetolactate synthase large subunit-like protein
MTPELAAVPNQLFRDASVYTETVSSPAQAPGVIHQAIAAAYAGRGVPHLTLPVDVISASTEGSVPASPRPSHDPKSWPVMPTLPRSLAASTKPEAS